MPARELVLARRRRRASRSPSRRDDRDVAALVDVLGLALARAPDEQRRVQLLGRRAPGAARARRAPSGRRSPPAATVASEAAAYPLDVKVLGIDPGTAACGYGIVHESDGRLRALDHGCWTSGARERPGAAAQDDLRRGQRRSSRSTSRTPSPSRSRSSAPTPASRSPSGRRAAPRSSRPRAAGVECTEYAPARVKQAVCGYGRADKGQVQRMVQDAPRARRRAADLARGRRARRRDLPRLDAAARADGVVRSAA